MVRGEGGGAVIVGGWQWEQQVLTHVELSHASRWFYCRRVPCPPRVAPVFALVGLGNQGRELHG